MHIQVNSNNSIDLNEDLIRSVIQTVEPQLSRFSRELTGVDVYLNDTNADKGGARDKYCLIEARVPGIDRLAARDEAPDILLAAKRCSQKLSRVLNHRLGKVRDHHGSTHVTGQYD